MSAAFPSTCFFFLFVFAINSQAYSYVSTKVLWSFSTRTSSSSHFDKAKQTMKMSKSDDWDRDFKIKKPAHLLQIGTKNTDAKNPLRDIEPKNSFRPAKMMASILLLMWSLNGWIPQETSSHIAMNSVSSRPRSALFRSQNEAFAMDSSSTLFEMTENSQSKPQKLPQRWRTDIPTLKGKTSIFMNDADLPSTNSLSSPPTSLPKQKPTTPKNPLSSLSPLEEAWTLVDKYYIDRTFNGNDWSQIRTSYLNRLGKTNDDDVTMKLTSEMIQSLGDKYSRILDRPSYARIQKFDLIGVGATLMPDPSTGRIIVGAPPVPGSAADRAGLKLGDVIVAVNGIPTKGRTAFDIIDQISEDPNAETVTMTVQSNVVAGSVDNQVEMGVDNKDGSARATPDKVAMKGLTKEVTMEREFAEVRDPIQYKISERRSDGTVVGYIRIVEFNSLVKTSLERALSSLQENGANAMVLDVRGNPGGAFQSAVEIAGLFVSNVIATDVLDANGVEVPFRTASDRVAWKPESPMAIWIDGRSASATEVLAGALHDNCRAVVMGDTSFGKGLIQAVYGLKNGYGLVLTVARYVTPNGTDIQGSGIKPDISGTLPPSFIPGLSSDTSRMDFEDISNRLKPPMCELSKVTSPASS